MAVALQKGKILVLHIGPRGSTSVLIIGALGGLRKELPRCKYLCLVKDSTPVSIKSSISGTGSSARSLTLR